MIRLVKSLILSTPVVLLSSVADAAPVDFGPLLIRTQAPLQSSGVTNRLRDASATPYNEVFISASMASVWAETDRYMLDYYQNDEFIGGQFAVTPYLKVEFSYLHRYAANNHLDSLSMDFHDLVGIGQNGRDEFDKHRFYIRTDNNEITDFKGDDINKAWELYVEQVLIDHGAFAVSLGGTLYYNNVSSGAFSGSSFEQAAQFNFTGRLSGEHTLYSMLSATHRNPEDFRDLPLEEWTFNWAAGLQYRPSNLHAFLMEYRIQEGEVKESTGLIPLNEHAHEITLGYRLHLGSAALELALVENVINMDNSADIAFSAALRYKF
jgi:hypothetical protein